MPEVFVRLLETDNCFVTCAVARGRIVGFCDFHFRHSLWQQGKLAYVDELVVDARASSLTPPFTAPRRTASTTAWVGKGARSSSARTLPDP